MSTSNQDLSKLNRQPMSKAATLTCLVLAVIAVAVRLLVRRKLAFKYGVDDLLIVLALGALVAYTISHFIGFSVGYGRPTKLVTNLHILTATSITNITAYSIGTALTEISILCFYSRMFKSRALNRLNWAVGGFAVSYNIASILVAALQCIPLSSIWKHTPGKCINTSPPSLVLGIINFITDVAIVCIPIRFVLRLQMDTFRKFRVLCVFMTRVIVCAFGIVCVIMLTGLKPGDPSYNMTLPGAWSFAEAANGIVGACLPTMGGYITKKRVVSISYSVQAMIPSSRRRSPMGTSILNSTSHEEERSVHKDGVPRKVTEMERMSGETIAFPERVNAEPKNDSQGKIAAV